MSRKFEPGEEITVYLAGKPYETVIDEKGVQRFKGNRIIKDFVDKSVDLHTSQAENVFSLHEVAVKYAHSEYTFEEMLELYTNIGYSVSGFSDISIFEHLDIFNPAWLEDGLDEINYEVLRTFLLALDVHEQDIRNLFSDLVFSGKWGTNSYDDNRGGFLVAKTVTIEQGVSDWFKTQGLTLSEVTEKVKNTNESLLHLPEIEVLVENMEKNEKEV